jgi:hypothetical protein
MQEKLQQIALLPDFKASDEEIRNVAGPAAAAAAGPSLAPRCRSTGVRAAGAPDRRHLLI